MKLIIKNGSFLIWKQAPALYFGTLLTLNFLVGMSLWAALFPLIALILTGPKKWLSLLLSAIILIYTFTHYPFPERKEEGSFVVQIESVREGLKKGFLYFGTTSTSLPCMLYSPTWIDPSFIYHIEGTIKPTKGFSTFIQSTKEWEPIKKIAPVVKWRYEAKAKVKNYLASVIEERDAYFLLASFATGTIDDSILTKQFERAGLSHLLAVSGLNFALMALFFYFTSRLFLPRRGAYLATLLLLSLYFFFLGNTPPILRGWIASIVLFLGKMTERQSSGLNSLGAGLILAFFIDPVSSTNLGFQLSFLATGAIFLLYPPLDQFLKELLIEKESRVKRIIRQALALDVAVHITLFPLLLHTFHKLPLHSLFYNLVFPSLFTPTLLLLPIATLVHFLIPPLGLALHSLNSLYSHLLISLIDFRPFPHFTIYSDNFSSVAVALYLTILFLIALYWQERKEEENSFSALNK